MIRAGVFIGVDQTGGLQRLNDASKGAQRMHAWAVRQGMPDDTHAKLITDAAGKVTPDQIFDAIEAITKGAGVDQLILYFAGHGVNISRNEHWLLSDAPGKPSAAVDVTESVEFARFGDIQHVVIISDACRVAPEGIQAQSVRGVPVFPNLEPVGARSKPVDQFFACALGRTAAEVKDPAVAAGNFSALYTNVMLDALTGVRADVLEAGDDPADTFRYVRPDGLAQYLEIELAQRIKAVGLLAIVNQEPDAIIVSRKSWLARVKPVVTRGGSGPAWGPFDVEADLEPPLPGSAEQPSSNLGRLSADLVRLVVTADAAAVSEQLDWARTASAPGAADLVDTAERIAAPFGPEHFETECGIKVRGARMVDAFATRADLDQITPDGQVLRVLRLDNPAASVLVTFEGRLRARPTFGTVVPCIPGFIAGLTFDADELVDVAYEPSANNWRWQEYQSSASEIRVLRGVAASSAQHGRFRLDAEDAGAIAQKMQYAKSIDPTMAVYAAYAYYDLQTVARIGEMSGNLRDDLGVSLFDVELLALKLGGTQPGAWDRVVPFVPLLSQGWPLLNAHRIGLHPALNGIEHTMRDSLWSLFNGNGIEKLRDALQTKEVR
jgi:hypothetical protein